MLRAFLPANMIGWVVLLQATAQFAVQPILPLYARERGADLAMIGWMVGAGMLANLLFLVPAGMLGDRIGRRPVLALGLAAYALAAVGLLLATDPRAYVACRFVEGLGAACFLPAALGYLADTTRAGRGRAIAGLGAALSIGMLLGPLVGGGLATRLGLAMPFVALLVLSGLAALLLWRLEPVPPVHALTTPHGPLPWGALAGVAARAFSMGYTMGMFEVVWALYLRSLGGTAWDVSLSWSLYALPPILLAPLAGRLLDRRGAAWPLVLGTLVSAALITSYGLVRSVPWLIGLGVIEAMGGAFGAPAQQALMVQLAPPEARGRVIALLGAVGILGALVGSLATPPLYQLGPEICFGMATLVLLVSAFVVVLGTPKGPAEATGASS